MRPGLLRRIWGGASALLEVSPRLRWVDLLVAVGLAGILFGVLDVAREWREYRPAVEIDLSPWALPRYTFYSLSRGLAAYVLSLFFTLCYGYWAAKDKVAERVLVPLLDILQSIPVLGFMPGLVLALVALFPASNVGLELAAVIMIFTGQAWNMTFSFYHSVRSVPVDQQEVATIYRFNWWQRFRCVELPWSTMGLVWNSMMSMAGGWFFLMINEAFKLGGKDFRLPGVGSYMSVAVDAGRPDAELWAVIAMALMIVLLDQLLWRPVVVWAQKFRVEEAGQQEEASSWFLDLLRRSHILAAVGTSLDWFRRRAAAARAPAQAAPHDPLAPRPWASALSVTLFLALLAGLSWGAWQLLLLLRAVPWQQWRGLGADAGLTLARVLVSTAVGTLWAVPAGLAIGLSPRLSRILQPVVQVVASFPAPLFFPILVAALSRSGISLGWGSMLLMLLGTQWYILFNVIAGAMAIPADMREAARSYRVTGWRLFRVLYLPAVFPYLVTGWVTAAGGAWNASIVAEYMAMPGGVMTTAGLGADISTAAASDDFAGLAASVLLMSAVVVVFNRTVWRWCYNLAERRYSLNR